MVQQNTPLNNGTNAPVANPPIQIDAAKLADPKFLEMLRESGISQEQIDKAIAEANKNINSPFYRKLMRNVDAYDKSKATGEHQNDFVLGEDLLQMVKNFLHMILDGFRSNDQSHAAGDVGEDKSAAAIRK